MKRENRVKKIFDSARRREVFVYLISFVFITLALAFTYQAPRYEYFSDDTNLLGDESVGRSAALNSVTEAGLALGAAEEANLPIANNVLERTSSMIIRQQMAQNEDESINKTIIDADANSPAILEYTAVKGDNVALLAKQFGISEQTIKWANNLTSNDINSGKKLFLPIVDGVVYKVRDGDTIESIVEKYGSSRDQILAINDIDDIVVGERIVLPGGDLPLNERPGYSRPSISSSSRLTSGSIGSSWLGIDPSVNTGNAYAFGNCTYYAYNKRAQLGRPIGSFWGNAYSWDESAMAAGFVVDRIPEPGAIFQTNYGGGGYGHVGIVDSVNDDGSITVSDMNAICGYNCVGTARWDMATWSQYNYIH